MKCAVVITAYNEEANIGCVLQALYAQRLTRVAIAQILVVASGCTDRTEAIVTAYAREHPEIILVHQPRREGKASAINLAKRHLVAYEVIVLHSADVIPARETIERLVAPFDDPQVGMTGAHPVPTNSPTSLMGYTAHLLWELHHRVALQRPKMGEVIAFRNVFRQIPTDSAVDEASIEPLIIGQGLKVCYVPEAIVYNRGPETVRDFLKQRRRIYAGHLYLQEKLGYRVATMGLLPALFTLFRRGTMGAYSACRPAVGNTVFLHHAVWASAAIVLELGGRLLGLVDHVTRRKSLFIWPVAKTTKAPLSVMLGADNTDMVVWPISGASTTIVRPAGEENSLPHAE